MVRREPSMWDHSLQSQIEIGSSKWILYELKFATLLLHVLELSAWAVFVYYLEKEQASEYKE
jgi:hypothetical protein